MINGPEYLHPVYSSIEYRELYDGNVSTDVLSQDALDNVIRSNLQYLRAASQQYRLDDLLSAMLTYAPDPSGKRYVAAALHIANRNGRDAVVGLANAWMHHLFFPIFTICQAIESETSRSLEMPTGDTTTTHFDRATRSTKRRLREGVTMREGHRCAITGVLDVEIMLKNSKEENERIPEDSRTVGFMTAAPIIPFSLHKCNAEISEYLTEKRYLYLGHVSVLDLDDLEGPGGLNINAPVNAIYMTITENYPFREFLSYFDKDAYPQTPNKYKVQTVDEIFLLSNGLRSVDVEFRTLTNSGIDPPDPKLMSIHAAFAKVLHLSGASIYLLKLDHNTESYDEQFHDRIIDVSALLTSKLEDLTF